MKSVAPGMYQLMVLDESEAHTITSEPVADDFDDLGGDGRSAGEGDGEARSQGAGGGG